MEFFNQNHTTDMNFSTPPKQDPVHSVTSGGIRFKVFKVGNGSSAYFRLKADGGQVGTYTDLDSAKKAIDDYLSERRSVNKRRKPSSK